MSDNRDAINDILKELDTKNQAPAEEAEKPAASLDKEAFEPEDEAPVKEYVAPVKDNASADEPQQQAPGLGEQMGYGQPQYGQAPPEGYPYRPNGMPPHKKKKRKKKRQSSRLPGVLILTTLIFGVSIILSLVIISFGKDMLGIGKSDKTQLVVVDEGMTVEDVSVLLHKEGIIQSPKAFQFFTKLRKDNSYYIAGQHFLRPNMAYEAIIDELTKIPTEEKGESIQVTFPEGINLLDASKILQDEGVCNADDFIFYFNSGGFGFEFEDLLPLDASMKFEKMEGYLFPDTYFFYQNSDPEEVCQKIYYNFNLKLTPERIAKMKAANLSLDQLITFASIVQAEAPSQEDMVKVASVFWNRLENSDVYPKLESDPTSNYANKVVRPNMEYFDQSFVDAYDTYKSTGLPPGAICNPGIEAIDAVLAHQKSDYFYFVANINTKVTYYATTNEEHEANVAKVNQEYADAAAAAAAEE